MEPPHCMSCCLTHVICEKQNFPRRWGVLSHIIRKRNDQQSNDTFANQFGCHYIKGAVWLRNAKIKHVHVWIEWTWGPGRDLQWELQRAMDDHQSTVSIKHLLRICMSITYHSLATMGHTTSSIFYTGCAIITSSAVCTCTCITMSTFSRYLHHYMV